MIENLWDEFRYSPLGRYAIYFVKWSIVGCLEGTLGGLIGGVFALGIVAATNIRAEMPWMLYLMPLAGLLIVWLYRVTGETKNRGTNMVIDSVSAEDHVTGATGPLILIGTVLTHLVGGSAGREGAALQIGGWMGTWIGRIPCFRLDEKERKIAVMCGMAAVFGALFGTPVAAGIFCMEVFSVGIMYYAAMLPCFLASFIGREISVSMGVHPEVFSIGAVPTLDYRNVWPVFLLGILLAVLSIVFVLVLHGTEHKLKEWFPNPYIRVVAASVVFIAATLLLRTRVYCGGSMILIEQSLEGHVQWEAFILKMLFTALALGAGFKGGEIIPTLCVGATFGCALGTLLGFEPVLMAACGMIGLFAAVTNCPIASIMIALEMFQGVGLPFFAIVVALSFTMSGYYSLYGSQKFVYNKIRNEYMNRKSNG